MGKPLIFLCKLSFAIALTLGLAELGSRAYWRFSHQLSIFKPEKILYSSYPGLLHIDHQRPQKNDASFDILLLGGSTLNPSKSQVEQALMENFALAGHRQVRCFNLAYLAHTSRDSWLKYQQLKGLDFDAVVLYQGINEVRSNNIDSETFKTDYSHFSWYERINTLSEHHNNSRWALAYTAEIFVIQLKQSLFPSSYLPTHRPPPTLSAFGSDIKSAAAFEHNLRSMLKLAQQKDEPFFLISFASHLPDNYSLEGFLNKKLDYLVHDMPVEVWGEPANVAKGIAAHNGVLRSLRSQHPESHYIDLDRDMSQQGHFFNDICHFSLKGSQRFAQQLFDKLLPLVSAHGQQRDSVMADQTGDLTAEASL